MIVSKIILQIKHLESLQLPQKMLFPLYKGENQGETGCGWNANPELLPETASYPMDSRTSGPDTPLSGMRFTGSMHLPPSFCLLLF